MAEIKRISPGPRISGAVVHGDTVYVAGTVAADPSAGVKGQTEQILKRIDEVLAAAGTSKSRILSATVWLANMGTYDEMNAAWDAWLDKANPPARATVESHLAAPKYQVEIACIAAR
jgi:enamine deaminase RidA (YjgF/YER057c/UK114 family)